jgi:hypothetical protein
MNEHTTFKVSERPLMQALAKELVKLKRATARPVSSMLSASPHLGWNPPEAVKNGQTWW